MRQLISRVFLPMALLLAVLWAGTQPQRWIPALLQWWQPQLELRAFSGLAWRDAQLHIGHLELRWLQHDLQLHALTLTVDWDWPLPVLRTVAVREVVYRSTGASGATTGVAALPRFWDQGTWARLAPLAGVVEHFSLSLDDTLLLSGALRWSSGLESADVNLQWSAQALTLRWHSVAQAHWKLDWDFNGALLSVGSADLRWDDPWLSWRAATRVDYADWSIPLQSHGRAQVFDTLDTEATITLQSATGSWSDYDWHDVHIEAQFVGTPPQWKLHSAHASAGSFAIGERWRGSDVRLTFGEAQLWPSRSPLALPQAEFSLGHLASDDPAVSAQLWGQWDAGAVVLGPGGTVTGAFSATMLAEYGGHSLPEMSLTASFRNTSEKAALQGQFVLEQAPVPFDFLADYSSATGLHASVNLDGSAAEPGAWTAIALASSGQFLPTLQSLQFQPQLKLRLSAKEGAEVHLDLSGQLSDIAFATESMAASGATLGPFNARLQGQRLDVKAPWQVGALRAGVEMHALAGELHIDGASRQLRAFRADWLGGVVSIANWDWTEGGTVLLRGLDLGAAVALLGRPEITVTGVIDGELPARIEEGALSIQAGRVYAVAPGVIRYRAADGSAVSAAQPLDTVYRVLANLHYDVLDAGVTYEPDGELMLVTRIEGYNPDMGRAQPIHLNLNVEQNVLSLLRSLRAADNVNSWLERRMLLPSR